MRTRASDVPRSSKSWRRRERDRRRAILQAQFRSLEIRRLLWTLTPHDDVAGAPGQGEDDTSTAPEALSFDLVGCGRDSASCLGKSSVGAPAMCYAALAPVVEYIASALAVSNIAPETMHTGCGDLPSASPSCDTSPKLIETTNLQVNTPDGGSIDLTSSGLESIFCLGNEDSSSAAPDDHPSDALSSYTGSKLSETVGLSTFASDTGSLDSEGSDLESIPCLGKSFTNVEPVASPADDQTSEMLYQLAEVSGASKTLPGTLGFWALVVDAAPCDASAMSDGLLTTMIQDDTESEELVA